MSDTHLVQSILKGDQTAFQGLVEKYQKQVYAVVLSHIRDETQAQDLTQETFIRAYMNLESLKDPERLGPWIAGIARNVALKWLSRHRQLESLEGFMADGDDVELDFQPAFRAAEGLDANTAPEQDEMRQHLWRGIYALDSDFREVLILFYIRQMKRVEIAEFLGISEDAVRNRLHKGRNLLKKEMLRMLEQNVQDRELPENFTEKVVAEAMAHGEKYLADKAWEKAKREFQRATDVQEDYAPAYRGIGLAARGQVLEQLGQPKGKVDPVLLEQAYAELSRAYRLGAKDWDTVQTLGELYQQFGRCEEQVQIFLDYSRTAKEPLDAFKAGVEAAHEMGALCTGNYAEAVALHQQLLTKYAKAVPPDERLLSYGGLYTAYKETNCLECWLGGMESLETEALPRISSPLKRLCYVRWRCLAYRGLGRYDESIRMGEEYIDFMLTHETSHPHYRYYLLDAYPQLLQSYKAEGQTEKIEQALTFIEKTIADYKAEWKSRVEALEQMRASERHQWGQSYAEMEDLWLPYPSDNRKENIRRWLDRTYPKGLDYIYHNIGGGFAWIGEGERALRFFEKKQDQRYGNHNIWLTQIAVDCGDRKRALKYLKRAAADRGWVARGLLRQWLERHPGSEPVRNDPRFQVVVNATVL
ncbi:sigma-70 family RNA polymerase sigma factor [Candidatus Poribacteria bacterium]|nr:sigma-70 family RNA polymerase sigma factor [Candidatus Poribacteria bacterium]